MWVVAPSSDEAELLGRHLIRCRHCWRVPMLLDYAQRVLCLAGVVRLCRFLEKGENYLTFAAREMETYSRRSWQIWQCWRWRPGTGLVGCWWRVFSGWLCFPSNASSASRAGVGRRIRNPTLLISSACSSTTSAWPRYGSVSLQLVNSSLQSLGCTSWLRWPWLGSRKPVKEYFPFLL